MTKQYNRAVAKHYSAFRPPLHRLILDRMIASCESFQNGLDVGCGTGYSAVALTNYCDRVFGLDSSQPMLDHAQKHPKITYICGSGEELSQIPVRAFDVVTFAGSLFYTKTDKLRKELARVCRPGGTVLVYDFEVLLEDVIDEVGVKCLPVPSDYNHAVNLSDWAEFATVANGRERIRLDASEEEIAHILLADSNRYEAFVARFSKSDPFGSLADYFKQRPSKVQLHADIYFARHRKL